MTGHVHLILSVTEGELSDVIRDLKIHTSREIRKEVGNKELPESRREWLI